MGAATDVQEMVENSGEAQSSVQQTHGQTGQKKKAAPKGGGQNNMRKKEGTDDALQKKGTDARDAVVGRKQDPSTSTPKEDQRPEEEQQHRMAKPALATSGNTEVAATAIQSESKSNQHQCADKVKKVNVQEMVEISDEAQSSVQQTHGQTGKKKKAAPKGGGQNNMMKKEGKDDAVQKKGTDARDAVAGRKQDPSISRPKEGQRPEEEQQHRMAKPALATSGNTEVAATAIQYAWRSSRHQCADKAKTVNA